MGAERSPTLAGTGAGQQVEQQVAQGPHVALGSGLAAGGHAGGRQGDRARGVDQEVVGVDRAVSPTGRVLARQGEGDDAAHVGHLLHIQNRESIKQQHAA
jgi:hypothetical protein